ncbi:hypothetical protein [Pseudoalteromonas luteoviolacea]|uniref:hypothetical protein n=1 Tax=Pseudoalteromonas luteoviolacea TaxID=43657 RepID=UPI0011501A5B|nr:hypothetical protein [Pseudoalteromonas luteoviolacea]TQF67797.1 hypothetical protein FLM44_21705 [Pseudoalteromonas luteoviolacea]
MQLKLNKKKIKSLSRTNAVSAEATPRVAGGWAPHTKNMFCQEHSFGPFYCNTNESECIEKTREIHTCAC